MSHSVSLKALTVLRLTRAIGTPRRRGRARKARPLRALLVKGTEPETQFNQPVDHGGYDS